MCSLAKDQSQVFSTRVLGETVVDPEIETILGKFEDIFKESKGMPPLRGINHTIRFKERDSSISLRPYRYPTP